MLVGLLLLKIPTAVVYGIFGNSDILGIIYWIYDKMILYDDDEDDDDIPYRILIL